MNSGKLTPRVVPLVYLGTAHMSLALAGFLVGWSPRAVAGFFYRSWMVAIVHLVTLGWITFSILGANLYRRSRGAGHADARSSCGLRRICLRGCRPHRDGRAFLNPGVRWDGVVGELPLHLPIEEQQQLLETEPLSAHLETVLAHLHAFLPQSGGNERRREDLYQ